MSFLFRKISRNKWDSIPAEIELTLPELPADVFARCLVAKSSSLSLWVSESSVYAENEDILAALFTSRPEGPEPSDIVVLNKENLDSTFEAVYDHSIGQTPAIDSVNEKHVNLTQLKYVGISQFAVAVIERINDVKTIEQGEKDAWPDDRPVRRFARREVIDIVGRQVDSGKIDKDELSPKWKRALNIA